MSLAALVPKLSAIVHFILFFGFLLLETYRPRHAIPEGRWRHVGRHIALNLLNLVLYGGLSVAATALDVYCQRHRVGLLPALPLPAFLKLILGLLLLDLSDYWFHRLEHRIPWLWRFHRVHHTDQALDVTTSLRTHPIALLGLWTFMELCLLVIGAPLSVLLLYFGIGALLSHWQHANLELVGRQLERKLAWFVNTPRAHRRHHSREPGHASSNYSDVLSLWDRLFGTYGGLGPDAIRFGLAGYDRPQGQSLIAMLRIPFRGPR